MSKKIDYKSRGVNGASVMNHNILQKICDNLYSKYVYEVKIYVPKRGSFGNYIPSVTLVRKLFSKLDDAKVFMKKEYARNMSELELPSYIMDTFGTYGSDWLYNNVKHILSKPNTTNREKYENLFEFLFEQYSNSFVGEPDIPTCIYRLRRINLY